MTASPETYSPHADEEALAAMRAVRPYTMLYPATLLSLIHLVRFIVRNDIPGDFVECGTWRGGGSMLAALELKRLGAGDRTVYMCDSFQGLPEPDEVDGHLAQRWVGGGGDSRWQLDNCRVPIAEVQDAAAKLGVDDVVELVPGWFSESLPPLAEQLDQVAFVHVDCDWYASVKCCLEQLYDPVVEGGILAINDYYYFDGCALAVHEFLAERRLSHRIDTVASIRGRELYREAAVIRKTTEATPAALRARLAPEAHVFCGDGADLSIDIETMLHARAGPRRD
jgi:O-methyltransferase